MYPRLRKKFQEQLLSIILASKTLLQEKGTRQGGRKEGRKARENLESALLTSTDKDQVA